LRKRMELEGIPLHIPRCNSQGVEGGVEGGQRIARGLAAAMQLRLLSLGRAKLHTLDQSASKALKCFLQYL
jgi:hypothetical protein